MKSRSLFMTLGIVALAAGCSSSPVTPRQPGVPGFDGGLGMGSGNRGDSTVTNAAPTVRRVGAAISGSHDTQTAVGGLGMGSGN